MFPLYFCYNQNQPTPSSSFVNATSRHALGPSYHQNHWGNVATNSTYAIFFIDIASITCKLVTCVNAMIWIAIEHNTLVLSSSHVQSKRACCWEHRGLDNNVDHRGAVTGTIARSIRLFFERNNKHLLPATRKPIKLCVSSYWSWYWSFTSNPFWTPFTHIG